MDQKKISSRSLDQLVLEIGEFFLGTPYVNGTLEAEKAEHLIVNLREFDCVTFIENIVALVWFLKSGEKSFKMFLSFLQKIRYRKGRLQGYGSRLHYFSDWIRDNQKKGMVRDVTAEIGGRPFKKIINVMTTHPELYPALKNVANLKSMKSIERSISRRSMFYIPKKALKRLEGRIRNGDLIAVTTNVKGLDIQHVGLAKRVKNRIHLLHASRTEGRVILSQKTLYGYLIQSSARSGIMVARIF